LFSTTCELHNENKGHRSTIYFVPLLFFNSLQISH
jgi:hypothetical protein